MLNFNSPDYLPHSEKRLEYLRKIIRGRPVAILAAGPSIAELEKRIGELRQADICYFGMNSFFVQEDHILQKISKHFSVIAAGANQGLPPVFDRIVGFLNRNRDNLFVSSFYESRFDLLGKDFDLKKFLREYDEKLLFVSARTGRATPSSRQPLHFPIGNTLAGLILLALIGKASKIVLFGADGFCRKDVLEHYYRPAEILVVPVPNEALILDTNRHFNPVLPAAVHRIYQAYGLPPVEILNCSEKSFYTPFPTISYDHAFAYLVKQEKYNPSWDTRPNPWIRLRREFVLFQLPQIRKIINQRLRAVIKFILPRSWFLVLHRRLQYLRHFLKKPD